MDGSGVPHMTVSGGVLSLGGKLHIPLEGVVQRAGSEIFINIPKLVASKMPWHESPTQQSQQDKRGPPLDSVSDSRELSAGRQRRDEGGRVRGRAGGHRAERSSRRWDSVIGSDRGNEAS